MDPYILTTYGYPLLGERVSTSGSNDGPRAYNAIFAKGNSFEGIFELTFSEQSSDARNSAVSNMYGHGGTSRTALLSANENLMESAIESNSKTYADTKLFPVTTDYRSLTGFRYVSSGAFGILKYVVGEIDGSASKFGTANQTNWKEGTGDASGQWVNVDNERINWIFYRLSEIMLMRAEAEINLANIIGGESAAPSEDTGSGVKMRRAKQNGASLSTAEELYNDAFELISAVYMRSNPYAQNTTTQFRPIRDNYSNYSDLMTLLENERHREFLFEGKRYFDLVRFARREGNTSHFAAAVASKFGEASKSVVIKMAMMDFMYMPYAEKELDVNPYLHQNPAHAEDEDIKKN